MKHLIKKLFIFLLLQFIFIFGVFAQENRIKDSLSIEETWKLLSTYEKLSFDEGLEIIFHIKYDQNDSVSYKLLTDSIFNFIYKDFILYNIRERQIMDSLRKIIRDTLKFSLEINQKNITDYKNIKIYISYIKDNKRNVLKLQTIDSLIILPSCDLVFDSVYIIVQFKDKYLNLYQHSYFKKYYHLKKLVIIHETFPFTNILTNWSVRHIRERARTNNSEGFLYIVFDCFGDTCSCAEILIPDIKKYYKIGKQLVKNK